MVVAVDGDVRRDVRVFYRSNALDKRIPDSCCTGRNRRRTSRDVRHLIRLIEIGFVVVPGEAPTPLREESIRRRETVSRQVYPAGRSSNPRQFDGA